MLGLTIRKAIKAEYKPSSGKIVGQFPAETLALVTGRGISSIWSAFVQQAKTNPQLSQGLDAVRQQLTTVNIDLDKDIFGWMVNLHLPQFHLINDFWGLWGLGELW